MQERNPTKRIPKSLGTDAKLLGRFTLSDVAVALVPGVVVVLCVQLFVPPGLTVAGYHLQSLTIPVAGVLVLFGALFVSLTPMYATSMEWAESILGFYSGSTDHPHDEAKQYTQVERIHPEAGAIERTDGAMVGMVQVIPPTMALATDEEWAAKTESFQNFLNTTVEFPIQIYSTTRDFPAEEYLAHYEARLDDPDVAANPQLEALVEHYIEWYADELAERRMTIRDHYVVVPVAPDEIQFEADGVLAGLADVPVFGGFVRAVYAPHREVERVALCDELDERLRRVRTGLREIEGCNATRVDVTDAVRIVGEFWDGGSQEYGDIDQVLRTNAFVRGRSR